MIVCVCVTEYACTIIWCNMLCQIRNNKIIKKKKKLFKEIKVSDFKI